MLSDEHKLIHTEFRKYLRTIECETSHMLNTLINAAENNLPALIRNSICQDFGCIYDEQYDIQKLISLSTKIKSDETILAGPYGFISSKAIDAYIRFFAYKNGIDLSSFVFSEEQIVADSDEDDKIHLIEGRLTESKILRRQRNRKARQQCIEASGYKCYVCGFDFEKAYGELGKGFIEVHHKKPLSSYDDEHPIPSSELCCLCSNCHSMVHRGKDILDVDELKKMFNEQKVKSL